MICLFVFAFLWPSGYWAEARKRCSLGVHPYWGVSEGQGGRASKWRASRHNSEGTRAVVTPRPEGDGLQGCRDVRCNPEVETWPEEKQKTNKHANTLQKSSTAGTEAFTAHAGTVRFHSTLKQGEEI